MLILQKLGPPSRSGANGREYLFETQSGAEGNILSPSPSPPPLYSDVVSGCKSVQCTSNRLSFCCHLQRLQILLTVEKIVEASERHPFHLFVVLPNIKKQLCTKGPKLSQSQMGGVNTVSLASGTLGFLGTRSHLLLKQINSLHYDCHLLDFI